MFRCFPHCHCCCYCCCCHRRGPLVVVGHGGGCGGCSARMNTQQMTFDFFRTQTCRRCEQYAHRTRSRCRIQKLDRRIRKTPAPVETSRLTNDKLQTEISTQKYSVPQWKLRTKKIVSVARNEPGKESLEMWPIAVGGIRSVRTEFTK